MCVLGRKGLGSGRCRVESGSGVWVESGFGSGSSSNGCLTSDGLSETSTITRAIQGWLTLEWRLTSDGLNSDQQSQEQFKMDKWLDT